MCLCHTVSCQPALDGSTMGRRTLLRGTGAVGLTAPLLAGCDGDGWVINLVPESQVQALGLQTWQQIRAATPVSTNQRRQGIVRGIADRLLAANGHDASRWDVQLFASEQVNAFALPGGRIGVFEGMFRVAQNRDQMAAVIGHEIGHVVARHAQSRMNADAMRNLGLWLIRVVLGLGDVPYADQIAAILGAGAEFGILLPYSRKQELQADRLGLFAMARAGFNPEQAPELWRRMDAMVPQSGPTFLATHPAPKTRIEELQAMVPQARAQAAGS